MTIDRELTGRILRFRVSEYLCSIEDDDVCLEYIDFIFEALSYHWQRRWYAVYDAEVDFSALEQALGEFVCTDVWTPREDGGER